MIGDQVVGDDASADEMFANDPLEHRRIALAIPRSFRVDDGDRATFTDAEAVGFRPQDPALVGQTKLLQAALQKFPCFIAALPLAAFWFRLITAEKNVALRGRDANLLRQLLQIFN